MANPAIPIAGPVRLPIEAASTSSVPIIGPVHENDTRASVKAMKNMLIRPEAFSALLSTELLHFEGSVISKPPKNDMANITRSRKNARLNHAFVESSFNFPAPNNPVIMRPRARYIIMMLSP